MNYLIDTKVISELRKQDRGHLKVKQWFSQISSEQLFTSVLVIGELRKGVEQIRRRDATAAYHLEVWLNTLTEHFSERILIVDHLIAEEWGKMSALRPLSTIDGLLAATVKVKGLTLVTRNIKDIQHLEINWLNPFA
ncbi:MAG: type II toxin-antitoxin system VapC family toxin [Thioploca sp.]|nr:type II toxin-antitoxin system VapC family toxin [Thioploca sp.]